MTKIKICGLSRKEDICTVNACMPDYIGFVFAKSTRQVSIVQAAKLRDQLDRRILSVGVFVNSDLSFIASCAHHASLDVLQLHGDEDEAFIKNLKDHIPHIEVWKAIRPVNETQLLAGATLADKLLIDADSPGSYGGSGKLANWSLAKRAVSMIEKPIILAGGLHIHNVQSAICTAVPYGIDVSSGVETGGKKDPAKIKEFIDAIRRKENEKR